MTTVRRILAAVVGCVLVAPLAAAHELPTEESITECGGTAPETTSCTTGTHRSATTLFNFFMWVYGDYVGTLEYRLDGFGAHYVARWTVRADDSTHFEEEGDGIFLPLLQYSHSCQSFELETSTPGGTGGWGCVHGHDLG